MFQEVRVKRKSLRDILPAKNGGASNFPPPQETPSAQSSSPVRPIDRSALTTRSKSRRRWWLWLGIIIVLLFIYFGSLVFSHVTVEITPAPFDLVINETITIPRGSGAGLNFDVITLEPRETSVVVKASGMEKVSLKASGQIVIYNNYDKNSQKLVANTRFQSKEGKIYRIQEAVTVPGTKTVAGKVTPGAVEVVVYADQPGAEYNSEPTDFTIPGFKGDPRFDKFFARSKTVLTGGLIGEVPKVSEEEASKARVTLRADLTKELLTEARSKIPADFVLFDGATLIKFRDTSTQSSSSTGMAVLKETATFQAIILPRQALSESLIGDRVPNFLANELTISNIAELSVSLIGSPVSSLTDITDLNLQIKGSARLIPAINREELISKLVGVTKSGVNDILDQVKGVAKHRVIFRPVWLRAIPDDPARIEIKLPAY